MKRKVLLAFIAMLITTAFSAAVYAAENTADIKNRKAYALLEALEVISDTYSESGEDEILSRGEFTDMFVKTIDLDINTKTLNPFSDVSAVHKYKNSISAAYENGYVGGYDDGTFGPDNAVLLADCKNMARKALGLNKDTENCSDYLMEIEQNLQKGISLKNNEQMTRNDAVMFLYNMLMSKTMVYTPQYKIVMFEDTLIDKLYGIYEKKGKIEANSYSSLESASGVGYGNIRIDNVIFKGNQNKLNEYYDLLGYNVTYFAREKEGEADELISLVPNEKNSVLYIECYELPENCYDGEKLSYSEIDGKKLKYAKISQTATFNYNGVYYGSQIEPSAFDVELGDITLIDNDGDNVYDVVNIMDYDVLVAGNRIFDNLKIIHDKHTTGDCVRLDDSDENLIINVTINGKRATARDIMVNDCLSFAVGKIGDDEKVVTVKVNRDSVSGNIDSVGSKYITIEGKEYIASENVKIKPAQRGDSLRAGKNVTAYFDYLGQISIIYNNAESELTYGFVLDVVESDPGSESMIFKLYTLGNDFAKLETDSSVRINGKKFTNISDVRDELTGSKLSEFAQYSDKLYQIVKYNIKDGVLTDIWTTASNDERAPRLDFDFAKRKYKNSGEFGSKWRDFYASGGNLMFIPSPDESGNLDVDGFYVCKQDAITNGGEYYIAGYDCDELRNSPFQLAIYDYTELYPVAALNYIVLSNELIVDDNGEIKRQLKLAYKCTEYVKRTVNTEVGEDLLPGDIINIIEDVNKDIVFLQRIVNMNAKLIQQGFNSAYGQDSFMYNTRYMLGYLEDFYEGRGIVTYNKELSADASVDPGKGVINTTGNFTVFNMRTGKARYETYDCLTKYISTSGTDYLFYVYETYGAIQDIIVYEL